MSVAQDIIQGLREAHIFELFKDTPIERVQQIAKAENEKKLLVLPCTAERLIKELDLENGECLAGKAGIDRFADCRFSCFECFTESLGLAEKAETDGDFVEEEE